MVLCLALGGCVKYHPQPLDAARVEQAYRSRSLADAGLREYLRAHGKPAASALDLNTLTLVAWYYSPELAAARARWRTAEAAVITAKALPNPGVAAGAGAESSPDAPAVGHFDPDFLLETAGKRGLRALEAEKLAEAAQVGVAEAAWQVRSRVRAAWLDYVYARHAVDLLGAEQRARSQAVALVEARLEAGDAARPDAEVQRAALITTEIALSQARGQRDEAMAAVAQAVSLPVTAIQNSAIADPPPVPASLPLARVQEAGLLNRADVRRSLLEYAAADAHLRLEIARQYPDIDLSPSYAFEEATHMFMLSPALPVPLFHRNRGPIAEAEGRRAEAAARFGVVQAQAIGDVERALAGYHAALAEMRQAQDRLMHVERAREASVSRAVAAGQEDRVALNAAQVETAVASRAGLEALRRAETALGALEDAVQQPLEQGFEVPGK